ncbi:MAG: NifU family protein [Blastocatellia bacterium]|nr:NifU family protein [Blastocatellia bacterium]
MSLDLSVTREQVEKVLDRIRPALHANGNDVELSGIEGTNVRVTLIGRFESGTGSMIALRLGLERSLREAIPGIGEVIADPAETGEMPYTE